jgi:hypothetical protein
MHVQASGHFFELKRTLLRNRSPFKSFKTFTRYAPFKTFKPGSGSRGQGFRGAKKRFGLSVFNYTVTSNHIHLLVKNTDPEAP